MNRIIISTIFSFILILGIQANTLDSLQIIKLEQQNDLLKHELIQLQNNYEVHKNVVEGFSYRSSWLEILVGILGGIVGIISIALPLMIYFFQIRPAEKIISEVKNIDAKVEQKLKEYLENEENTRINQALIDITSKVDRISNNASLILSFNQTYDFKEDQLFKVYSALKSDLAVSKKSVLAMILNSKETNFADEYFSEILQKGQAGIMLITHCIRYFCLVGINKHMDKIRIYILTSNEATTNKNMISSNYFFVSIHMLMYSPNSFIELINDPILHSEVDLALRKIVYTSLKSNAISYGVEKEFNESLLAKDIKGD